MTPEIPNVGQAAQHQSTRVMCMLLCYWRRLETPEEQLKCKIPQWCKPLQPRIHLQNLLYLASDMHHKQSFCEHLALSEHFTPPALHPSTQSAQFWGRREEMELGRVCGIRSATQAQRALRSAELHKTVAFQPNRSWHGEPETTRECDATFRGYWKVASYSAITAGKQCLWDLI